MSSPFTGGSQREHGWMRRAAAAARAVQRDLVGEHVDRARSEAGRARRVRARAAAGDERGEPAETSDVEAVERIGHRGDTEDARAALACTLVRQIPEHARRLREPARVLRKDGDGARTDRAAEWRE